MSNATDHLALARDYIAIAESQDAKLEAYIKAIDEIIAWLAEDHRRTHQGAADGVGRSRTWVTKLVQWRTNGEHVHGLPFGRGNVKLDQQRERYHAKQALSDPEQRRRVIASLDDDEREAIVDTAIEVTAQEARAISAEHRTEPTLGGVGGVGGFTDRTAFEIDVPLTKAWRLVRQVARTIHENGLWIGEDRYDEMIERATELESAASEIRAAIQEARNERSFA